ncbi:unnamed protein product, partial [Discosporangium mesarthrocarpum]
DEGWLFARCVESWSLPEYHAFQIPYCILSGGVPWATNPRSKRPDGGRPSWARKDYEALCSLVSMVTRDHAQRLPNGLQLRRFINSMFRAVSSSPTTSLSRPAFQQGEPEDELLAMVPSRSTLSMVLCLARAGLFQSPAEAIQAVVRAASVRPRGARVDAVRDRSIALVAPAASALFLILSAPPDHDPGGNQQKRVRGMGGEGGTGAGGDAARRGLGAEAATAELLEVLVGGLRDSVAVLERVLKAAKRLGHAVDPRKLERPNAAIGLCVSCVLLVLRQAGPLAAASCEQSLTGSSSNSDTLVEGYGTLPPGSGGAGVTVEIRWVPAVAVAMRFLASLGSALGHFEHLSRSVSRAILAALQECFPLPPLGGEGRHPGLRREVAWGGGHGRGFRCSGQWLDPAIDKGVSQPHRQDSMTNETSVQGIGTEDKGVLEDEYGSWDFEEVDLDDILSEHGNQTGTRSQPATEISPPARARTGAGTGASAVTATETAAAEAAAAAEEAWGRLAEGMKEHVLPHLRRISRKSWTSARYTLPSLVHGARQPAHHFSGHGQANTHGPSRVNPVAGARRSRDPSAVVAPSADHASDHPVDQDPNLLNLGGAVHVPTGFLADAGVILELHASAALAIFCRGKGGAQAHCPRSQDQGWVEVRRHYLSLHSQSPDPAVPEQRLLAAAFFSLALGKARQAMVVLGLVPRVTGQSSGSTAMARSGAGGGDRGSGISVARCQERNLLAEMLRGVEWEVLQLWVQSALDPMSFPQPPRRVRRRGLRRSRSEDARRMQGMRQPSDLIRDSFEGFTECLATAFGVAQGRGGGRSSSTSNNSTTRSGTSDVGGGDHGLKGVFERRLTKFEVDELADLSEQERQVLERVLDLQSVVVHMAESWGEAKSFARSQPAASTGLKNRVVHVAQAAITALKRFLPEVFHAGDCGNRPHSTEHYTRFVSRPGGYRNGARSAAFRALYGRASFALAGMLVRICSEPLKGPLLRDLIGVCFDSVACRGAKALPDRSGAREGVGGKGRSGEVVAEGEVREDKRAEPGRQMTSHHLELVELSVMHLPDLILCFAQ